MWDMGDGWGWWMIFGWLWMIGLIAVVVWAVSSLTRPRSGRASPWHRETTLSPLEILERRYASGELNDEQFEQMRNQLRRSSQA